MNDTEKENKSDEDSESLEEEEVDPRIQVQSNKIHFDWCIWEFTSTKSI